jgi:hypothetical protein
MKIILTMLALFMGTALFSEVKISGIVIGKQHNYP